MNENGFGPADAPRLVAVGQLQLSAERTRSRFYEDRYLRAADNILNGIGEADPDPDLLSLGRFSSPEIALAIAAPVTGESPRVAMLRQVGTDIRKRSITNVKRSVRRRAERQRSLNADVPARDRLEDVDNRLDCDELISLLATSQERVLQLRLRGLTDIEISGVTGLSCSNVAVIAHRGHQQIRKALARRASTGPQTPRTA